MTDRGIHGTPRQALIGVGQVRHTRLRPVRHAFAYRTWFLMLPMRSIASHGAGDLAVNRPALVSFRDDDHGDGRGPAAGGALGWVLELLDSQGINDADGEIWLHCYPRVLGYAFKPVSFWYCERADGTLRAIVVEVNNTFGERHCYLLDNPAHGVELRADKVFHVSPFCRVEGSYRFRFMRTAFPGQDRCGMANPPRTVVRIDYDDPHGPLLQTSVSGTLTAATTRSLRQVLWSQRAMTFAVIARIHWQALQLWARRVPFFRKPELPSAFVTR